MILNNFINDNILVVDGLRHKKCIDYFKNIVRKVIHINVNTSEEFRKNNIILRDGQYFESQEKFETERQSEELINDCDYTISEKTNDCDLYNFINNAIKYKTNNL